MQLTVELWIQFGDKNAGKAIRLLQGYIAIMRGPRGHCGGWKTHVDIRNNKVLIKSEGGV